MKIKYKWICIALITIIVIGLAIDFMIPGDNNSNKNNTLDIDVNNHIYKFKIFEYEIPEGLKFSDYKNKRFKIEGNGWYIIVGICYDSDSIIYDDIENFQVAIKNAADEITISDVIMIDDTKVITFQRSKSILAYFATDFGFDYEVEIFNNDGSYKTDALNEIIGPLLNVTYENDGSNDFYVGRFELDSQDED